jgi:hypothetical protein
MIIDPEAYMEHCQGELNWSLILHSHCPQCILPIEISDAGISPRIMLLLPANVEGFHIWSRRWVSVPLVNLQPTEWYPELFEGPTCASRTKESLRMGVLSYLQDRRRWNGNSHENFSTTKPRGLVYHFRGK